MITPEIMESTIKWLGNDGIDFFTKELSKQGDLLHLHFRSGMQVRNFLRGTGLCNNWDDHDLDNNWIEIIKKAIKNDTAPKVLLSEEDIII